MMQRNLVAFVACAFIWSEASYAGWVGGGGAFIEDQTNPWFLSNTKKIRYCVLTDEVNFGQNQQRAIEVTESAIAMWQRELRHLQPISQHHNHNPVVPSLLALDTNFVYVSQCDGSEDITFQYGVLTAEQQENLIDIKKYASLAVRTSYDSKLMKGKGFIYLPPQSGTSRMSDRVVKNPWSFANGSLMQLFVAHELGHVFGALHEDAHWLMNENIAEILNLIDPLRYDSPLYQLRKVAEGKDFIYESDQRNLTWDLSSMDNNRRTRPDLRKIWGADPKDHILQFQFVDKTLTVLAAQSPSHAYERIGSCNFEMVDDWRWRKFGRIWVPREQTVHSSLVPNSYLAYGLLPLTYLSRCHYESSNHSIKRQINYSHLMGGFGGEYEGVFYLSFLAGM